MRYFLTLLLSIFLNLNVAQAQDIEIEVAQLKNLLDSNAVVVDIRREEEWEQRCGPCRRGKAAMGWHATWPAAAAAPPPWSQREGREVC